MPFRIAMGKHRAFIFRHLRPIRTCFRTRGLAKLDLVLPHPCFFYHFFRVNMCVSVTVTVLWRLQSWDKRGPDQGLEPHKSLMLPFEAIGKAHLKLSSRCPSLNVACLLIFSHIQKVYARNCRES